GNHRVGVVREQQAGVQQPGHGQVAGVLGGAADLRLGIAAGGRDTDRRLARDGHVPNLSRARLWHDRRAVGRVARQAAMSDHKWVYDFAEGSRDIRELLGGKGANVAEMTRVLGTERVPAGFTITTEACVAFMRSGSEPEGLEEQVADAMKRL